MLDRCTVHVEPAFLAALGGVAPSYDTFMRNSLGSGVTSERGREVRRWFPLGRSAPAYYLKRNWQALPLAWIVRRLLRLTRLRSRGVDEAHALLALGRHGFNVVQPMAWGERTVLGIPVEGFLVVSEAPGVEAGALWLKAPHLRGSLMRQMGKLIGRLHACGFPEVVRCKDIYCRETALPSAPPELVLIDRETSRGRPYRNPALSRFMSAVAESYVTFIEIGAEPNLRQLACFAREYLKEVCGREAPATRSFLTSARDALGRLEGSPQLLATVRRSKWLRAPLTAAPARLRRV